MSAVAARLVYDSARSWAVVGARAALPDGRSLVFCGGGLTVDLVVHTGGDSWGYHYGQVIRTADERPVVGATVALDAGPAVTTDDCGQFTLSTAEPRAARVLRVATAGGLSLDLDLPGCDSASDVT